MRLKKTLDKLSKMPLGSADSTHCLTSEEIAEAITDNTKNNFSRVVGLPYFCGGAVKSQTAPHLKCATSAQSWIRDLENRTQTNWDENGRIELAKSYALDSAYTHLVHCATKHKNVWEDVKKTFLEIYPDERSLPGLMGELSAVTRQPGETLTELYIRLQTLIDKLEELKPAGKEVYEDMFVSIFLTALPKDFSYILQDADLKKPLAVYKKALKYVASHPNLRLTDAEIRKERQHHTVNAVINENKTPILNQRAPLGSRPKMRCQKCHLTNHNTQNCRAIECFRCHQYGHSSRNCRTRLPVTCYACGMYGHIDRECRNTQWPHKKKTSNHWQQ